MSEKFVIIDYLTFTSKIDTVDTLKSFLGFSDLPFQELKGRYFYKKRLSFDGINIYYDGLDDNMGVCVELSGKGCRNFEKLGTGDYNELLNYIVSNPNELNITRLDLAFDDFDNLLDFDTIIEHIKSKNYVSRFRIFRTINEYSQTEEYESTTVYCGSDKSDTLFRIYDKRAEQERFDLQHWVRFEVQLRDDRALCFANLLMSGNSLGSLFVKVINNYLRFVVPNDDSNRSRWITAGWWFKFLGTIEKISLFIPDVDYTETRLEKFVKKQCSGALVAFIALFGFSTFRNVIQGKSQLHINTKYEKLLKEHGIDNINDLFLNDWWNISDNN